jgi:hypothetical protein
VTPALDESIWFDRNPDRRYRARPAADGRVWLIRRRPGNVFLCTLARLARVPSSEGEAERWWWLTAWPELSPRERAELIKESRRGRPKRRAA